MADIGTAFIQIVPSAEGITGSITNLLGGEVDQAGMTQGKNLAGKLAKGVLAGGALVTGAVVGLGKSIVTGASNLAQYGDNIDKMSQKLGFSAQAYQEWDAILQHSGANVESLGAVMRTLNNAAESGSGAFEALGMSLEEVQSLSQEDLFSKTITALQGVEDETTRTRLANDLLGRGATELGALLNTSAEDTENMRQRVHELGGVLDNDAVAASARFQDSLQDMQTAMDGVKNGIVSQFLPGLSDIMDGFTQLIAGEEGAEETSTAGFDNLLAAASSAGGQVLSLVATLLPQIITTIVEHLPEIVQQGAEILLQLIVGLIGALPQLIASIPEIIVAIITAFAEADWPQIGKDLIDGIIKGLKDGASRLFQAIKDLIRGSKNAGEQEAETGSPSKLFARELGKPMVEGIAMGIDQNAYVVDQAVMRSVDVAYNDLRSVSPVVNVERDAGADRIIEALERLQLQADVRLEGDARKMFRVVRNENTVQTRRTAYNALAAGV